MANPTGLPETRATTSRMSDGGEGAVRVRVWIRAARETGQYERIGGGCELIAEGGLVNEDGPGMEAEGWDGPVHLSKGTRFSGGNSRSLMNDGSNAVIWIRARSA